MSTERVAIITGSTSGIGLASAEVLAAQGIHIALHGLVSADEGNQLATEMAAPRMIGELIAYLCSDNAANITGAALPIEGGWTAQ